MYQLVYNKKIFEIWRPLKYFPWNFSANLEQACQEKSLDGPHSKL